MGLTAGSFSLARGHLLQHEPAVGGMGGDAAERLEALPHRPDGLLPLPRSRNSKIGRERGDGGLVTWAATPAQMHVAGNKPSRKTPKLCQIKQRHKRRRGGPWQAWREAAFITDGDEDVALASPAQHLAAVSTRLTDRSVAPRSASPHLGPAYGPEPRRPPSAADAGCAASRPAASPALPGPVPAM